MIIDKKLRWVGRHVGSEGLASLLVYPEDVLAATVRIRPQGLSMPEASRKLQIPVNTFRELAARNIVVGQGIRDTMSGRVRLRFSESELDRFESEYVSLFNLSLARGRGSKVVRRELLDRGITTAAGMEGLKTTFYRKADVETYH